MQRQTIGGYHILDKIDSGGQGAVYKAWDPSNGQVVALKTLLPNGAANSDGVERFRRESELTAQVAHPNIIRILDNGRDEDHHFIAMEFLPSSVADLIRSVGQLHMARAVDICRQAAQGLQAASEHGIIHRDIKPSNLLVAPDGTVKVTDFGLARASDLPTITSPNAVMGTVKYMSPEQAEGKRLDTRTDIYSIGIVLYEMLAGSVPFDAETVPALMKKQVEERPESVRQRRQGVPRRLDYVVNKCLAKRREDRFQTHDELAFVLASLAVSNQVALIDLYEATDGPNWRKNTNWLSDLPISKWYGVTTDCHGNVVRLNLRDNGLMGRIPAALANLANLAHLDLVDNTYLSGQIPPDMGRLTSLQELLLSNCGLVGRLPGELGCLTNLRRLHLIESAIIGELPHELCGLPNLEDLTIAGTAMSGEIPSELCNLAKLKDLYLPGNQFTGEIPSGLCDLDSLELLYLAGNNWTGCIPRGLRKVPDNDLSEVGLPFCGS